MRPIDADALKRIAFLCENADIRFSKQFMAVAVSDIDSAPTLSPDDVRGVGEWITTRTWEHDGEPYCSKCGFEQSHMRFEKFKYCPSCGAWMKGVSEE